MTAGTARRLLSGDDLATALTVAEHARREDVRLILDVLGLPREGHQPQHLGSLPELADAFGTDLRLGRAPGRPMTVEAAEDVHEHSDACATWPPHGGVWPVPLQGTAPSLESGDPSFKETTTPPLVVDLDAVLFEAARAEALAAVEACLQPSEPVEEPDTAPVPDQALALSREARDHAADQALDDVERLVQRVQKYRPTDTPPLPPRGPLTVRCAACHRPIPHDPGKAAAALSEHYTTQHPGGSK